MASGSWDNTIRLWQLSPGNSIAALIENIKNPGAMNFTHEDLVQKLKTIEQQTGFQLQGIQPVPIGAETLKDGADHE